MPKNKVLTLYQKAKICEISLTPGFSKEKCEKRQEKTGKKNRAPSKMYWGKFWIKDMKWMMIENV